uniref:Uncharacterized protein n=2 Tax=Micrurus TaxID=8634 RepID=A0A2D4G6A5_MICCO
MVMYNFYELILFRKDSEFCHKIINNYIQYCLLPSDSGSLQTLKHLKMQTKAKKDGRENKPGWGIMENAKWCKSSLSKGLGKETHLWRTFKIAVVGCLNLRRNLVPKGRHYYREDVLPES